MWVGESWLVDLNLTHFVYPVRIVADQWKCSDSMSQEWRWCGRGRGVTFIWHRRFIDIPADGLEVTCLYSRCKPVVQGM